MVRYPSDCVMSPKVHICLGNTLILLDEVLFKFFLWIELKASESETNSPSLLFRKTIEDELVEIKKYIAWLEDQKKEVTHSIEISDC